MPTATTNRSAAAPTLAALLALAGLSHLASAQPANLGLLQWFESEWDDIERRVPDFFMAGYGGVWIPPVSKTSAFQSPGYDPFDRFDLGKPPLLTNAANRARTTYGTENTFRAMVKELQRANGLVYVDGIFNHNSGRTTSDAFLAQGGWPGFWIPRENPPRNKFPTDDWGDFHAGNAFGFLQSENPGGPNYDTELGDLVALIDIAQEENNVFIRQPVASGNALNIPGGTIWNQPDPGNARFYPDLQSTPLVFTNPGTSRYPVSQQFIRYPYNSANPMAGDAVAENATGLLMRWAQWMMQEHQIDGFRLDALKHAPVFFWDGFFDSAVYRTWTRPDGVVANPFTFGENTSGNGTIISQFVRKDSIANRDALDLSGAGSIRDLLNAGGFGSWNNIQNNTLDNSDDGFINGSLGMNHVFSHDNGSVGNGSSAPALPTVRQHGMAVHAFLLMRPGRTIVYHNARGVLRTSGFHPREGTPNALGGDPINGGLSDAMTTLMRLRNTVAYGSYVPLNSGSAGDVLVFERTQSGQANCLVGVSDRWDAGTISQTVTTSYPQGTRLREMTGNAANPDVDPAGVIPELITVGAGGQVTLTVPNNSSSVREHGRGYVVYAEALPSGTLTIEGASGTIAPDPSNFPAFFRRLNDMVVVNADTFTLRVATTQTDALDPNTDDNALFRINDGTQDWNGSGAPDFPWSTSVIGGYEQFITTRQPAFGSGGSTGLYRQTIDATRLDEGPNYVSVIAFRKRNAGTTPIFSDFREVIYVDRVAPVMDLAQADTTLDTLRPEWIVTEDGRTAERVYLLVDVPSGTDPLSLLNTNTEMRRYDRAEWRTTQATDLAPGDRVITIVAQEPSGRNGISTFTVTVPGKPCPADLTGDGQVDSGDLSAFVSAFLAGDLAADLTGDGQVDSGDLSTFVTLFLAGC